VLTKISSNNFGIINFVVFKTHGKVISDTPFFSEVIEGIEKEAKNLGYKIVITYLSESSTNFTTDLANIKQNIGKGIILMATEMQKKQFDYFKSFNVPIVIVDNAMVGVSENKILINNFEGAYKATKYLYEKGHTNIGYLHSSVNIKNFDERKGGFLHAVRELQLCDCSKYIVELESTMDGAYSDMLNYLMDNPELPTAFFADNDIIAVGAMKALKKQGFNVPDDVSLIGFDDMPYCTIMEPELTTMRVPKDTLGKLAVDKFFEIQESKNQYKTKVEIDTDIVERQSVKYIN